jgi:hypothetical protein
MKPVFNFLIAFCLLLSASSFQIIKTTLTVTVRDELGNTVEGATRFSYLKKKKITPQKKM